MVLRRGLLGLLLFALVAAQTLGLMHRVVHGAVFEPAAAVQEHEHQDRRGWADALFGEHDDPGCRLFDQLSHGGCLPSVPAVLLPVAAPSFFLQWFQGEALARWAALFDARGPPQLR